MPKKFEEVKKVRKHPAILFDKPQDKINKINRHPVSGPHSDKKNQHLKKTKDEIKNDTSGLLNDEDQKERTKIVKDLNFFKVNALPKKDLSLARKIPFKTSIQLLEEAGGTGFIKKAFLKSLETILKFIDDDSGATYFFSTKIFIKILGLVFLIAFASFYIQAPELVGKSGILPAETYLNQIKTVYGGLSYIKIPTIFWLNSTNVAINITCIIGIILSLFLIFLPSKTVKGERFKKLLILASVVIYLSIINIGQDFMAFQWDALLIEAGILAIFLTGNSKASRILIWLLIFKLMFLSGISKLLSGDLNWRNMSALSYYYLTQPSPTPLAWYMAKLPLVIQKISTVIMFIIDLFLPFLIVGTRKLRHIAGFIFIGFQILIILTGNYAFFNVLSIALCLMLFEDEFWMSFGKKFDIKKDGSELQTKSSAYAGLKKTCATIFLVLNLFIFWQTLIPKLTPKFISNINDFLSAYRLTNTYGLLPIIPANRFEIVLEGTNDGRRWSEYIVKNKPQELNDSLAWSAPYMPRLASEMWFLPFSNYDKNKWFLSLVEGILRDKKEAKSFFAENPFQDGAPKYIRALAYKYTFTDYEEKKQTGNYWHRDLMGTYMPDASLKLR